MAELKIKSKKQNIELTPFEKEQLDTLKKINEFKETNTWAHMLQPRIQLKGNGS